MDNATLARMVEERCAAMAVVRPVPVEVPMLVPIHEAPIDQAQLDQLVDQRAAVMPYELSEEAIQAPRVLPPVHVAEVPLSWEDVLRMSQQQQMERRTDEPLAEGAAPPEDEATWEWTRAPDEPLQ